MYFSSFLFIGPLFSFVFVWIYLKRKAHSTKQKESFWINNSLQSDFMVKSCLCFVYSVQCQHDQTALKNYVQHQLRVFWSAPQPLTYQRAAAGSGALSKHGGEAWAHKHWCLHGKCLHSKPEHLKGRWSSMLECTQLTPLALYSNDASLFTPTWILPSFF